VLQGGAVYVDCLTLNVSGELVGQIDSLVLKMLDQYADRYYARGDWELTAGETLCWRRLGVVSWRTL